MFTPLERAKCCGCMACADACPKGIIHQERDQLGFSYPVLTQPEKCIGCNRCMVVCPDREEKKVSRNAGEVYCACNRDEERRLRGSSGGIFEELAMQILDRGGVVFGAAFDGDFQVCHMAVQTAEDLCRIMGSKYVQSSTMGIFSTVKGCLQEGREVLFSGTPCQAAALRKYLGRAYERLYVADLFCYGVPAPAVWAQWLEHISQGRKPVSVCFRDKTDGWENYSLRVAFEDGSVYRRNKQQDLFLKTFPRGSYIRESCLYCSHKAFPRESDLSLGDFQELRELFPGTDGHKGMSMIRINTPKGERMLKECAEHLVLEKVSAERMDACHPGMGMPAMRHPKRALVEEKLGRIPVDKLLGKYAGMPWKQRLRFTVVGLLKRAHLYQKIKEIKSKF